jgi:hypothetical protein
MTYPIQFIGICGRWLVVAPRLRIVCQRNCPDGSGVKQPATGGGDVQATPQDGRLWLPFASGGIINSSQVAGLDLDKIAKRDPIYGCPGWDRSRGMLALA